MDTKQIAGPEPCVKQPAADVLSGVLPEDYILMRDGVIQWGTVTPFPEEPTLSFSREESGFTFTTEIYTDPETGSLGFKYKINGAEVFSATPGAITHIEGKPFLAERT